MFACPQCRESFGTDEGLFDHVRARHPRTCRCKRVMYVLAGTATLVCRTCDFATVDRGPVRLLRDQEKPG